MSRACPKSKSSLNGFFSFLFLYLVFPIYTSALCFSERYFSFPLLAEKKNKSQVSIYYVTVGPSLYYKTRLRGQ